MLSTNSVYMYTYIFPYSTNNYRFRTLAISTIAPSIGRSEHAIDEVLRDSLVNLMISNIFRRPPLQLLLDNLFLTYILWHGLLSITVFLSQSEGVTIFGSNITPKRTTNIKPKYHKSVLFDYEICKRYLMSKLSFLSRMKERIRFHILGHFCQRFDEIKYLP